MAFLIRAVSSLSTFIAMESSGSSTEKRRLPVKWTVVALDSNLVQAANAGILESWSPVLNGIATGEMTNYADSRASRHKDRFYRLQPGHAECSNVLGYVSITLPPGFSMNAKPLDAPTNTVGKASKSWPDGTTLTKFDTRLFRLVENAVKFSQWANPSERLTPGEGVRSLEITEPNQRATPCFFFDSL
jgi:hypothetical protein